MRFAPLLLLVFVLSSCQSDAIQPDTLARTWRFVGVGSHLADMVWNLDRFDYDNAPILNLTEPERVSGFSGVNAYDGRVKTTLEYTHPQQLAIGGKLTVASLRQTERAGTAAQMQVEKQLLTGLQQATTYYVDQANRSYYTLSISYGTTSNYLYFVSNLY